MVATYAVPLVALPRLRGDALARLVPDVLSPYRNLPRLAISGLQNKICLSNPSRNTAATKLNRKFYLAHAP